MDGYGDDFISITDEEGNEFELEVLDEADLNGVHYLATVEVEDEETNSGTELIILKVILDEETGEELLSTPDDDEELEAAFRFFEERIYEADDGYFDEYADGTPEE